MAFLFLSVFVGLYFTPAIIAIVRSHRQTTAIVLLNLFLGWTLIGWVVALVWSVTQPPAPVVIVHKQ